MNECVNRLMILSCCVYLVFSVVTCKLAGMFEKVRSLLSTALRNLDRQSSTKHAPEADVPTSQDFNHDGCTIEMNSLAHVHQGSPITNNTSDIQRPPDNLESSLSKAVREQCTLEHANRNFWEGLDGAPEEFTQ